MRPCPHLAGLQICLGESGQRPDLLGAIVRGWGTPPTLTRIFDVAYDLARKFHTLLAGGATECLEHYYGVEGRRDFRAYDKTLVACGAASGG